MTVTGSVIPGNGGHPLADAPLPYWLREPCPPWCDMTTPHHDSELYDDRLHQGSSCYVTLTTEPRTVIGQEEYDTSVSAGLWQHYRDSRPHIALQIGCSEEIVLELDEAAELARLLAAPPGEWETLTLSMMDPDAVSPQGPGGRRAAAERRHGLAFPFIRRPEAAVRLVLDTVTLFTLVRHAGGDQLPRYVDFTPAEATEFADAITAMVDGAR